MCHLEFQVIVVMQRNRYFLLSLLFAFIFLIMACVGGGQEKPSTVKVPPSPTIDPVEEPTSAPEPEPEPAPEPPKSEGEADDDEDLVQPDRPTTPVSEVTKIDKPTPVPPVDTELKGVTDNRGVLLYNIPDSMKVNKKETVDVRISRSLRMENMKRLKNRLPADAQPKLDTIITGEIMDVQLSEYDTTSRKFRITPLLVGEQILDTNDVAAWSWSVTPLVAGKHYLFVRVGIKQYSEKFNKEGYRYIPVWEKAIEVESNGNITAAKHPDDIPESYSGTDKPFNRLIGDDPASGPKSNNLIWWIAGLIAAVGLGLIFWLRKSKKPVFIKPPPIPKEKLDAVDELIKKDKLETALDVLETLVVVVRDKEHNQLIAYQAELKSFEQKYKSGEIKFEDYSVVRARIRRALIEMNDRLEEG